jgi:hypothetical protein
MLLELGQVLSSHLAAVLVHSKRALLALLRKKTFRHTKPILVIGVRHVGY